jgi:hypothetical protein
MKKAFFKIPVRWWCDACCFPIPLGNQGCCNWSLNQTQTRSSDAFERDIYGGVRRGSKDLTTFKTSVTQEKTNTPLTFFKATRATRSLDRGSNRQQQGRATWRKQKNVRKLVGIFKWKKKRI